MLRVSTLQSTSARISQNQASNFVCKFRKDTCSMPPPPISLAWQIELFVIAIYLQETHQRLQLHFDYNCLNVALVPVPPHSAGLGYPLSCTALPVRQLRGSCQSALLWLSFILRFSIYFFSCYCI